MGVGLEQSLSPEHVPPPAQPPWMHVRPAGQSASRVHAHSFPAHLPVAHADGWHTAAHTPAVHTSPSAHGWVWSQPTHVLVAASQKAVAGGQSESVVHPRAPRPRASSTAPTTATPSATTPSVSVTHRASVAARWRDVI
jgi:hypothetical protein